jgi:hypothetical protein
MHPAKQPDEYCAPFQCQNYYDLQNAGRRTIGKFSPWYGSKGYTQTPNGPEPDILYACPEPEIAQLERLSCSEFTFARYMSAAPRSNHPGGVCASFLDGRVTFLADDVDEFAMSVMINVDDELSPEQFGWQE